MTETETASGLLPWINVHFFCASGFDAMTQSQMDAVTVELDG